MSRTWIFQGNPSRYDIDGFLASNPASMTWLVTRYKELIAAGDQVFIWRSIGDGDESESGIVAEAVVLEPTALRPDDEASRPYWKEGGESKMADRAILRLVRVATKREVIKRKWIKEDPILNDLAVLKMANGTNYEVSSHHSQRLNALWLKAGHDWTRPESVAGLWAYMKTHGAEVSKLPGSPVATVSALISRAVGGVYNKVMNFRAIDPTDPRAGMSGGGTTDLKVWDEFFDQSTRQLRAADLDAEFNRLWGAGGVGAPPIDEADLMSANVATASNQLLNLPLDELIKRYEGSKNATSRKPKAKSVSTRLYERDPLVVAIAKKRSNFSCEVPGCTQLPFLDAHGNSYVEVHHVVTLAEGGEDSIDNAVCLCPSHHREVHFGADRLALTSALIAVRSS